MPGPGPRPWHCSEMLLLLMLLVVLQPPPAGALSPPEKGFQGFPGPSDLESDQDASRIPELPKRYEDLLTRLRVNRSWEDSNSDLNPAPAVRILTPELQLGSDGHLHLRVSRAALTKDIPAAFRLQRALLRLSPTALTTWDVTRPLKRQLSLGGPRAPVLRLRLSPPSDQWRALSPSAPPQLELRWRARAARGRRWARARSQDDCPLGPGRCCRLRTVRASLEDLGWSDWVLSPREVHVGVCVGACPSRFRSASMHAQVKARLHGLKPDSVPEPCCVPSSYQPLVIMQKSDGGVSFQTYDDLIAKDCHCA
ncbi:growth/differentiation factor 15 [Cynocephalus volans]|uniref:growth/differentiation factor 15 n=1 Tax=Cynocephalus volans TaxID=110931 RepID=UPI002FCB91C6